MQVLPVSNVANFQLWAVRARGRGQKRQECRFPEVWRVGMRGRVRPRFFVGVGGAFYSRQDGGSPYFGAGCPVKQMWPPRPCTASSSKGEGALATSRGEIGGRLGEATLPCGRDGARPSRCGRNKLRPSRWWSHSQVCPLSTSPTADQRAGGFSTRCPKRHRLSLRCWWLLAA